MTVNISARVLTVALLVTFGFGTAISGIAMGTVTGLLAFDRASEADRACPNRTCTDSSFCMGW